MLSHLNVPAGGTHTCVMVVGVVVTVLVLGIAKGSAIVVQ